jgi:hypothetical protein
MNKRGVFVQRDGLLEGLQGILVFLQSDENQALQDPCVGTFMRCFSTIRRESANSAPYSESGLTILEVWPAA